MLSDLAQMFPLPSGTLVIIQDWVDYDNIYLWDTYPGNYGYHKRVRLDTSGMPFQFLVLRSRGIFREILLGDQKLWIDLACLRNLQCVKIEQP